MIEDSERTIYVVRGTSGEYSSREEWLTRAFSTEAEAQAFVTFLDTKQQQIRPGGGCGPYADQAPIEAMKTFDPGYRDCGYTSTSWYVDPVTLGISALLALYVRETPPYEPPRSVLTGPKPETLAALEEYNASPEAFLGVLPEPEETFVPQDTPFIRHVVHKDGANTDLSAAPALTRVRGIYADGSEAIGEFIHHALGTEFVGEDAWDDDLHDGVWPIAWAPLTTPG